MNLRFYSSRYVIEFSFGSFGHKSLQVSICVPFERYLASFWQRFDVVLTPIVAGKWRHGVRYIWWTWCIVLIRWCVILRTNTALLFVFELCRRREKPKLGILTGQDACVVHGRSLCCYFNRANAPRLRHGHNPTYLFLTVQSQRFTFLVLTPKYHHGADPFKPFPQLKTLVIRHNLVRLLIIFFFFFFFFFFLFFLPFDFWFSLFLVSFSWLK